MKLEEIPLKEWEHLQNCRKCFSDVIRVFKNSRFLIQVRRHGDTERLSVNRVQYTKGPEGPVWLQGITWDELQEIKNLCGYENKWLVEYYPPKDAVINVANIRHLWVVDEPKYHLGKNSSQQD